MSRRSASREDHDFARLNTLPKQSRRALARKIFGSVFRLYVADREYDLCTDADSPWRVMLKITRPDVVITFDDHRVHYMDDVQFVRASFTVNGMPFILAPGEYNSLQIDDEFTMCHDCGYEIYRDLPPNRHYDGTCTQEHTDLVYSVLTAYQSVMMIEHCIYAALVSHAGPPAMRSDQFANTVFAAARVQSRFVLHCIWMHRESILQRLPKDVFLIISQLIVQ